MPAPPPPRAALARDLERFLTASLQAFPWRIEVRDWTGGAYRLGGDAPHWRGEPLALDVRAAPAARALLGLDGMAVLEHVVAGGLGITGNLYLLSQLRRYARLDLGLLPTALQVARNRAFQSQRRARVNVRSHYDIPQEVLDGYLDRVYKSYSCGMFEAPEALDVANLVRAGRGQHDAFDSLEKAQWRKFADAATFADPAPGQTVLDIGCGYGGQLRVGAELFPAARFTGWTHSVNQARTGRALLDAAGLGPEVTLRQGDYREDRGVYDHVLSTGMVSHVGPRGLVPYVRAVRRRIRPGGRYLHHALMRPFSRKPLEHFVGAAFNKKYVWPGFHWFSVGEHVRALEANGFRVLGLRNLSLHYRKTCAAWYERLMAGEDALRAPLGEQTFRAWQLYLAGSSEGFAAGHIEVHRIYCQAR